MGLFDQIKNSIVSQLKSDVNQQVRKTANNAVKGVTDAVKYAGQNKKKSFTFSALPQNVEELKALPEANLKDEFGVAALTVLGLIRYIDNKDDGIAMLNFLKGPQPLSNRDIDFMADRLRQCSYVAKSYIKGAKPENDYNVSAPYVIEIIENPYSRTESEPDYAKLFIQSGGADSPREVRLRKKQSTGEWFLWDQMLLSDIRQTKSSDVWA